MAKSSKCVLREMRLNAQGKLIGRASEVYLRNDVLCGLKSCEICAANGIEPNAQTKLFIPEFEVVRDYLDFLLAIELPNVIILQSFWERLKETAPSAHQRLRSAVEIDRSQQIYVFANRFCAETFVDASADDAAALRRAAAFYAKHAAPIAVAVLLGHSTPPIDGIAVHRLNELPALWPRKGAAVRDFLGLAPQTFAERAAAELLCDWPRLLSETEVRGGLGRGELFKGKLRVGRRGGAVVHSRGFGGEIVLPGALAVNRAAHGDLVAVRLLPVEKWAAGRDYEEDEEAVDEPKGAAREAIEAGLTPTGIVVTVLQRQSRQFVAELEAALGELCVLAPIDTRLPRLVVPTPEAIELRGKKVIAVAESWPEQSRYPIGRLVRVLGESGNTAIENDAILFEFGVETAAFSAAVIACLPAEGEAWTVPPAELARRRDLRDLLVFSVDPPGCKDIDDALHARLLPDGDLELGVHIADVGYFVRPDTPLDFEAARRGTTVYLVDRRTDMLPKLLTEKLCSLTANSDKLAFSAVVVFDAQTFAIRKTSFFRSVIRSSAALTYKAAQEKADNASDNSPIAVALRTLLAVARKLRAERVAQGALTLASSQQRFALDAELNPTDVAYYELVETNSMVEEFMLLANVKVAERIFEAFPGAAILRRHAKPKLDASRQLARVLSAFGFELAFESNKELAESLDRITRVDDPFFNRLVRILATRCMNEATYFCAADFDPSEFAHFGLAAPLYTHFTSPIRRYADVLVHRLLAAAVGDESLPEAMCRKQPLSALCDNLNLRTRNARNAARASSDYFCFVFFRERERVERAVIAGVQSNGFSVIVAKYGFEGFIAFSNEEIAENDRLIGAEQRIVAFFYRGKVRRLFEWENVKITVKMENYRKQIQIEIVE